MSMTNIHRLPLEIRCKIYDFLPFKSKKILRSVDRMIKNDVDECREFVFNVELKDETINLVQNVTFPRIDSLLVHEFTASAINSTTIPPIHTMIFEHEISFAGLEHLLKLSNDKNVEKLKFEHHFITAAATNVNGLEFGQYALPHVRTLEVMLGKYEDLVNHYGVCIGPEEDTNSRSKKLFEFLKNHLSLPSLERINILVDLTMTKAICSGEGPCSPFSQHMFSRIFNYVNGVTGLKYLVLNISAAQCRKHNLGYLLVSWRDRVDLVYRIDSEVKINGISLNCPQLEELELKLDIFSYSVGLAHKIGCMKELRINSEGPLESYSLTARMIADVITNNSNTLENISVISSDLPVYCLNLQICTNLKKLSLRTVGLGLEVSEFIDKPFPPEFYMGGKEPLRHVSLDIGYRKDAETEFLILQRILERIPNGMEELQFKPFKCLGFTKLKWILGVPNLRKLILAEVDPGYVEFMTRRCKKKIPGIVITATVVPKNWYNLRNMCIQK